MADHATSHTPTADASNNTHTIESTNVSEHSTLTNLELVSHQIQHSHHHHHHTYPTLDPAREPFLHPPSSYGTIARTPLRDDDEIEARMAPRQSSRPILFVFALGIACLVGIFILVSQQQQDPCWGQSPGLRCRGGDCVFC